MYPPMHLDAELNEDGTVRKPGQDYYLKPMNCPMHHLIYRARGGPTANFRCDSSSSAASTGMRNPA